MSRFSVNHLTSQNSNLTPAFVLIVGVLIAVPISVAISMAVVFTMLKQPVFASALNNNQTPNTTALANSQLAHSVQADAEGCTEPTVAQEEGHVLGASTTAVADDKPAAALPKPPVHHTSHHTENKTVTHTTINHNEKKIINNDYSKTWNKEVNVANTSTNVNVHNEVNIEGQGGKPSHHDKDKNWNQHDKKDNESGIDIDFDTDVNVHTSNNNVSPDVNVNVKEVNLELPTPEEYDNV